VLIIDGHDFTMICGIVITPRWC